MNNKSIYEIISSKVTSEGKLPNDFTLQNRKKSFNQLQFVAGARDGIGINNQSDENLKELITEVDTILRNLWENGDASSQLEKDQYHKDSERIISLLCNCNILALIECILESIYKNHDEIDICKMIQYADAFAFKSYDENLVKLGISLYGILDLTNVQELVDKLLILALYEEFTQYVVEVFSNSENGNALIFEIAKKTSGWGKIKAVEKLEPQTEEIKNWILKEGCQNSVMLSCLGLVCAKKGDLISALRQGNLDKELFNGISMIISALIEDESINCLSEYERIEEALCIYLIIAKSRINKLRQLWTILDIQHYIMNRNVENKLLLLCEEITNDSKWKEMIYDILQSGDHSEFFYAVHSARKLNLDISKQLFETVKKNPIKCYRYLDILFKYKEYATELVSLYESILPFDKMKESGSDCLFADTFKDEHRCIDFLLQELKEYPNTGEKIICAALYSRIVRERNVAIKVLLNWSDMLGKSLLKISPELFSVVKEVELVEVNQKTKELMSTLMYLEGKL